MPPAIVVADTEALNYYTYNNMWTPVVFCIICLGIFSNRAQPFISSTQKNLYASMHKAQS